MALTKDERRALELARERIESRKSHALCLALWSVAKECEELSASVDCLTKYIQRALSPNGMLTTWQAATLGQARWHSERADRLAWINWMLGKPLPGEAVKLEWHEISDESEEAEYCGRRFLLTWADWNSRYVVTEPDAAYHVIAEFPMNRRDEVDAAIVAHVWPEA